MSSYETLCDSVAERFTLSSWLDTQDSRPDIRQHAAQRSVWLDADAFAEHVAARRAAKCTSYQLPDARGEYTYSARYGRLVRRRAGE